MSVAHCYYHVELAQLPQHAGCHQVVDQIGQRSRPMAHRNALEECDALNADAETERSQLAAYEARE